MSYYKLKRLLTNPQVFADKKELAWERLIKNDTLFRTLQKTLETNAVNLDDLYLIVEWQEFAEFNGFLPQWEKALFLVWCAIQAKDRYKPLPENFAYRTVIYEQNLRYGDTFTNLFKDHSPSQLNIPIAREDSENKGLFTLQLSKFGGNGQIAPHPEDIFFSNANKDFEQSMKNAWLAARRLASEKDLDISGFDGCWRVVDKDNKPESNLVGNSAGGAAARGWLQLFDSHISLDERVIIMASTDDEGNLDRVGRIKRKNKSGMLQQNN